MLMVLPLQFWEFLAKPSQVVAKQLLFFMFWHHLI